MSGRSEVARLKDRLDATFARGGGITEEEIRADFARYLCVLVCGFLERSVVELLLHYTNTHAQTSVTRYVTWRLKIGFQNPSKGKITETVGIFDRMWKDDLEAYIVEERHAAISSVLTQRNAIAHGDWSDITYTRIKTYYEDILDVVNRIADLVVPAGTTAASPLTFR